MTILNRTEYEDTRRSKKGQTGNYILAGLDCEYNLLSANLAEIKSQIKLLEKEINTI